MMYKCYVYRFSLFSRFFRGNQHLKRGAGRQSSNVFVVPDENVRQLADLHELIVACVEVVLSVDDIDELSVRFDGEIHLDDILSITKLNEVG